MVRLSPCTNRPIKCESCNNIIWSYNISAHYKLDHPTLLTPCYLSSEERKKVKNLII